MPYASAQRGPGRPGPVPDARPDRPGDGGAGGTRGVTWPGCGDFSRRSCPPSTAAAPETRGVR